MKQLQNNFTTPVQSKRLLELGLPADSADCYFYTKVDKQPKILTSDKFDWLESPYFPCWSVGQLIEIFELCYIDRLESHTWYNHKEKGNSVIERVLWDFDDKKDKLDFSKLEDKQ